MIKVVFYLFFLTPLCFYNYWIFQSMLFIICFYTLILAKFDCLFGYVSYFFGLDLLSYILIVLRLWICVLIIMASSKIYLFNNYYNLFVFIVLLLLFSLILVFSSFNLLIFYLFFEIRLIPLLILIIGWGYQPERLISGLYIIFYTLFFSLPIIVGLFFLYKNYYSLMFFELKFVNNVLIYFFINLIFFVKIPIFIIHLWLPKAHVEAPVSGSIILAGVILKLGGYGLIRLIKLFLNYNLTLNIFIIVFRLIGGLIISLICLYQVDIKSLIAYSSVCHISLVISGILSCNILGFIGSLVLILGHGLCSSGLFFLSNIYYERLSSRSLYLIKGLINMLPGFSLWIFLLRINNISSPPSLNLLGEIFLFNSLISYSRILFVFLIFISFFRAYYSMYLYSYSNQGINFSGYYSFFCSLIREYLVLILHWFPLNFIIVFSDLFIFICLSSLN